MKEFSVSFIIRLYAHKKIRSLKKDQIMGNRMNVKNGICIILSFSGLIMQFHSFHPD